MKTKLIIHPIQQLQKILGTRCALNIPTRVVPDKRKYKRNRNKVVHE